MKISKNVSAIVLAVVFTLGLAGLVKAAATAVPLNDADSFAVLAGAGITNTGPTTITGDVGTYETLTETGFGSVTLTGTNHIGDAVTQSAKTSLVTAYGNAEGQTPPTTTYPAVHDLGGETLGPGIYTDPSSFGITGTLTLDGGGDPNAVFIFQAGSTLTTASASKIVMTGSADPCNVFWQVGSSATLGTNSIFKGNILALSSITLNTGANVEGRVLARNGAVTMDTNTIAKAVCGVPAPAPSAPTCTLSASPTSVHTNSQSVLSWTTTNAGTLSIDNGVGAVTPVASGSTSVSPSTTTTYTGTATGSGGSATCSATVTTSQSNNPQEGTINVIKTVINDSGGTKTVNDFPLFVNGNPVISGVTNTFPAPSIAYAVTETGNANYTRTFSGGCDSSGNLTLVPGDNKVCIVTNNDIGVPAPVVPPLIDVVKTANPLALPGGPGPVTYTYTLRNIGTVPVTNITMVGDTCSPIILASGDANSNSKLEVNETWVYRCTNTISTTHTNIVTTTGWANGISAIDVARATVIVGASVVPPLIHVEKVPSVFTLSAPGAVTYRYVVNNPGTEALSNVSITDDKCTGLPGRVSDHPGDLNKNNLLESNESWVFSCKTNLTQTTTNIATASGSANGLTATDLAFATVVVASPKLPNTGLPPQSTTPWGTVLLVGILGFIAIAFNITLKKRVA